MANSRVRVPKVKAADTTGDGRDLRGAILGALQKGDQSAMTALAGIHPTQRSVRRMDTPGCDHALFRARTADGKVYEGAIHGAGGRLGANGQGEPEAVVLAASYGLRGAIHCAQHGEKLRIVEPEPGAIQFVPTGVEDLEWKHREAAMLAIPLVGTTFEIMDGRSRLWMSFDNTSDRFLEGVLQKILASLRDTWVFEDKAKAMDDEFLVCEYAVQGVLLEDVRDLIAGLRPAEGPLRVAPFDMEALAAQAQVSLPLPRASSWEGSAPTFRAAVQSLVRLQEGLPGIWEEWGEKGHDSDPAFNALNKALGERIEGIRQVAGDERPRVAVVPVEARNGLALSVEALEDQLRYGRLPGGTAYRALLAARHALASPGGPSMEELTRAVQQHRKHLSGEEDFGSPENILDAAVLVLDRLAEDKP